jgi:hypothetical protein
MCKSLLAIALCCFGVWVSESSATDFTADRVVFKNGHQVRATLYCRTDMWRIEHNTSGPVDVTIVRKDKGLMWHLIARTKRFITLPFDPNSEPTCQHDLVSAQRRDLIGTETLQGRPTTLSEVTVRERDEDVTYYEWRADDVHLPLRVARKDGAWLADYTNLRVTRLSAQLFELPLHYRPLEMP